MPPRGRVDAAKSCLWQYSKVAVFPPFGTTANLNPYLVLTAKLVTYKYMAYKFNLGLTFTASKTQVYVLRVQGGLVKLFFLNINIAEVRQV